MAELYSQCLGMLPRAVESAIENVRVLLAFSP